MNYTEGIQRAVDYIEERLDEPLTFADIARQACMSSFHFQRIFSALSGISLGEYIRSRRLAQAGVELSTSDIKVIDTALKYGYETPESFAKAFSRFHEVSPRAAREPGVKLKSFGRLSIKVMLEGGKTMDYRIFEKKTMTLVGRCLIVRADDEKSAQAIPSFWSACGEDGTIHTLCGLRAKEHPSVGEGLFGICETISGDPACFRYIIGVETDDDPPEGFDRIMLPKATWAQFTCVGAMPEAIQRLWKRIFSEFFSQTGLKQKQAPDFEFYHPGDNSKPDYVSEIWIPVEIA